jgi:hypothetical protein
MGAVIIAVADLVLVSSAGPALPRMWPLITIWCVVPFVWGFWATLAPQSWVPARLPLWGGILGFIAGVMSGFVIGLPFRIFAIPVSLVTRFAVLAVMTVAYYFLWMLVRFAYRKLTPEEPDAAPVETPQLKRIA